MVEQWIPAKQALEIVADERVLTNRLRAGLLKSRAKILRSMGATFKDKDVDPEFWEADRYVDFKSDWESGDFSKCLDGDDVCVFGVTLELAGILAMVPFEERASLTRSLSVAGSADWLTAQAARAMLFNTPINPASAGNWIIEQGRLGFVTARAVQAEMRRAANDDYVGWSECEWDIPEWFWKNCTKPTSSSQSWESGRFLSVGRNPIGIGQLTLSGVHFHKRSFYELLGRPFDEKSEVVLSDAEQAKRGRRPIYDWQAATTAVWGQLLRGDLIPTVQADIEKALIAVLTVGDKEPSESTVRPYAKPIFDEYSKP